ncbi:NUDIX hydrolase [Ureibacillus sp. 179-F W5.1 NHS]|uniref:NUDIX domain-containing protein n=1 Tax=Lysinibacillus halotolerans TaxID=1368476 RepID=A0A3M8HBS0_9BACI|nr:NUDIX domain-containing protein [Lysinibacillus halotolerans]RNC99530.1 NUDIX domain-containing protein [Lysinibacillus halotolerans]
MTTTYVHWGESKVKLTWKKSEVLPQRHLITSVHGFCFQGGNLLLVHLNKRGWDFPGGHIESGESPENCLKREVLEEGYVEGESQLLGYIIVDHSENLFWTESSPYPKIGYQLFYKMTITKLLPFEGKFESSKRMFINPQDISAYHHEWNILYQHILDCTFQ